MAPSRIAFNTTAPGSKSSRWLPKYFIARTDKDSEIIFLCRKNKDSVTVVYCDGHSEDKPYTGLWIMDLSVPVRPITIDSFNALKHGYTPFTYEPIIP